MRTRVFRAILFLAVLSACAMPAAAGQKKPRIKAQGSESHTAAARPAADTACPADDGVGRAGLRAFIDPQTGQLREPTPAERAALTRAAREQFTRAVESLQPVVLPDGTVSLDLKGLFMQDLIARRNPDGSLSMRCVPDSEKTVAFATPPFPAPRPALEEK